MEGDRRVATGASAVGKGTSLRRHRGEIACRCRRRHRRVGSGTEEAGRSRDVAGVMVASCRRDRRASPAGRGGIEGASGLKSRRGCCDDVEGESVSLFDVSALYGSLPDGVAQGPTAVRLVSDGDLRIVFGYLVCDGHELGDDGDRDALGGAIGVSGGVE